MIILYQSKSHSLSESHKATQRNILGLLFGGFCFGCWWGHTEVRRATFSSQNN